MEGNMLMVILLGALGLALSNPVQPNYDNIPQCMQPAVTGLCLAYFPSYYYNPGTETCETFVYGGCRGNENRFFSFAECMATCGGFKPESNDAFKLVLESDENSCSLPSKTGPCKAMMPRFYFNGDDCESFVYGGCEGNENNFISVEDCRQKCGSKSSEEVEGSPEENSAQSEESDSKSEE